MFNFCRSGNFRSKLHQFLIMFSIWKKELGQFFSSFTGYIAIFLFLIVNGIFLFLFPDSSILDSGYASLDKFFELSPWILLFLVPALCMRAFADEFRTGTFEILKTRPLTSWQIILGKYFSVLVIIFFAIIPTILYAVTIKILSTTGTIDSGGISGSYIGLFFLAAVFAGISICCSSFTSNAIVAFFISCLFCLLLYFGFNELSKLEIFRGSADYYLQMLGIDFHYKSISRGVVDSRDIIYFISVIFLFLLITAKNIKVK